MEHFADAMPTVSKLSHFYYDTIKKLQFKYNKTRIHFLRDVSFRMYPKNTDTNIPCESDWLINSELDFQQTMIFDHSDSLIWTNVFVERS